MVCGMRYILPSDISRRVVAISTWGAWEDLLKITTFPRAWRSTDDTAKLPGKIPSRTSLIERVRINNLFSSRGSCVRADTAFSAMVVVRDVTRASIRANHRLAKTHTPKIINDENIIFHFLRILREGARRRGGGSW